MECVDGRGSPDHNGYLRAPQNGYAHRVAYEEHVGPIPEGMVVHHTCENKLCINPEHMELMTHEAHSRLHHPPLPPGERARRIRERRRSEQHREWNRLYMREYRQGLRRRTA